MLDLASNGRVAVTRALATGPRSTRRTGKDGSQRGRLMDEAVEPTVGGTGAKRATTTAQCASPPGTTGTNRPDSARTTHPL